MRGKPKKWNDDWIRANYLNYSSYKDMAEEYSRLFDDTCKATSLKRHALRIGLKKPRLTHYPYTEKQSEWLAKYYPEHGVTDTVKAFNEQFNEHKTKSAIKGWAMARGITVNADVTLKNKCRTMHGKGSKREIKDVGATRMESGRLVMKTENGEWKPIGKAVYEQEYGKVPKGYIVIHLNGDRFDYRLENLCAIPQRVWGVISRYEMIYGDAELTKASIKWAMLHNAVKDAKKGA